MNGVLIDDKRIKVDFSQSVSKYWINYKKNINNDNNINQDKINEGNNLTLINENVKLEIKNQNNFQYGNKDKNNNQYKYLFNTDNNNDYKYNKKEKKKERSRDKNYHSSKQYYHSSHHHKYKH